MGLQSRFQNFLTTKRSPIWYIELLVIVTVYILRKTWKVHHNVNNLILIILLFLMRYNIVVKVHVLQTFPTENLVL